MQQQVQRRSDIKHCCNAACVEHRSASSSSGRACTGAGHFDIEAAQLQQCPYNHRGMCRTEDSGLLSDAGIAWHPLQSADLVGPAAAFLLWPFQPTLSCWAPAIGQ